MSVKFVAFALVAATGAVLVASEPAVSRGGGGGGARFAPAAARIMPMARRPFFRPSLRSEFAHSGPARAFQHARPLIPPSARGYGTITPQRPFATTGAHRPFATTTPARPFANLVRRHHRIYHSGWSFPVTFGGDGYPGYYIGTPYDPTEAFPVYGPAPADDSADPPPARGPVTSRAVNATQGETCRSEQVTVPAGEGERTIKVVRC